MKKRILIAVDDSTYSRKAVEYAAQMKDLVTDLSFILFNVQPTISDYLVNDSKRDAKASAALKEVIAKNKETSKELLEKYKSQMVKTGVDESAIELVTQPKVMGAAKDILVYAKNQLPDAIVLGRRGTSRLQEAFVGSIVNTVLEHASIVPIWAIDGNITSSKIMVAIDGSESSLNAVDHISYMVGNNPNAELTLLHVTPTLRDYCTIDFDKEKEGDIVDKVIARGDKQCVDDFYAHARQRFEAAGIRGDQISIKSVKSTINIGKTIVDEAKKGEYGIIVVGRKGMSDSFFMGSVSRYVVNKASNCAVWLVP